MILDAREVGFVGVFDIKVTAKTLSTAIVALPAYSNNTHACPPIGSLSSLVRSR